MKRIAFLILSLGVFLTADCAIAKSAKDIATKHVLYTNAPKEVAFDASCTALERLGYQIEEKDADNLSVTGSYTNRWAGPGPLHAKINVTEEAKATKIAYGVAQSGAVDFLDVTGRCGRCADNLRKTIEKILAQGEIGYRKSKKARESSAEEQ